MPTVATPVAVPLRRISEGSPGGHQPATQRDDVRQLWKSINSLEAQLRSTNQANNQMAKKLESQRRRILGGSGGTSVAAQGFQLVSDGGDYYNCYMFDGISTSGSIIKVAKIQNNRCTLPSATPAGGAIVAKTIRGVAYTFTYAPSASATADSVDVIEYTRTVTRVSDSATVDSLVTPFLKVGDEIQAVPCKFAGPASLVDVSWIIIDSPEFADPDA